MTDPYNEGSLAFSNGQHRWENPYHTMEEDGSWYLWHRGHTEAEEQYFEEMDGKEDT